MTTSTARRLTTSIASFGAIVLDAIEASRAIQTAHTTQARREVLDRFAADSARHAEQTAA
jgi:hypothetical protein